MPRLRRPEPPSGVPTELFDRDHEVWMSQAATEAWIAVHEITIRRDPYGDRLSYGPLNRFDACLQGWAQRAGLIKRWSGGGWSTDLNAIRALGINPDMSARLSREKYMARKGPIT